MAFAKATDRLQYPSCTECKPLLCEECCDPVTAGNVVQGGCVLVTSCQALMVEEEKIIIIIYFLYFLIFSLLFVLLHMVSPSD